jgi:hypothetical protein
MEGGGAQDQFPQRGSITFGGTNTQEDNKVAKVES